MPRIGQALRRTSARGKKPHGGAGGVGGGGSRRLLRQSDFAYLGAFKIDSTNTFERPVGAAVRWVAGQKRFMVVDRSGWKLVELTVPALVGTSSNWANGTGLNAAGLVKRWASSPFGSAAVGHLGSGGDLWGVSWDETDRRLYWVEASPYDTGSDPLATFGWAGIDDAGDVLTPGNRVSLTSPRVPQKQIQGGVLNIPASFASAYLSGKRLGVGFGSYRSVIDQGSIGSYGPALYAIDPPGGSPADGDSIAGGPCLLRATTSEPRPIRPGFAGTANDFLFSSNFAGEDPTTYGALTQYQQAMVWVDDGTRYGVIVAASFGGGNLLGVVQPGTTPTSLVLDRVADAHAGEAIQVQYGGSVGDPNPSQRATAIIASVSGNTITLTAAAQDNGTPVTAMVGGFARTGAAYQNSVLRYSNWQAHGWMVYDPADLALVAQGSVNPYNVTFRDSWSQPPPDISLPLYGESFNTGSAGGPSAPALTYDPVEKRVYAYWLTGNYKAGTLGSYPLVFVYQLN